MAACYLRKPKDKWDIMIWLLLVQKISFRKSIWVIRKSTIVSIVKGWNSCHKGTDSILRIGLGSHEFNGFPFLEHFKPLGEVCGAVRGTPAQ